MEKIKRSPKTSQSVKVLKKNSPSRTLHVGQWKRVTESQVHELGRPQLCWGVSGSRLGAGWASHEEPRGAKYSPEDAPVGSLMRTSGGRRGWGVLGSD